MIAASFSNAGHSKGLNYNVFCSGQVVLPNGRWCVVGGTDKAGNIGIRKINLFDPATETWLPRPMPPVKADYLADPNGLRPHSDPLIELNTDPPLPSAMRYRRCYPTAVTLPDGRALILSGTDEDASLGPAQAPKSGRPIAKETPHRKRSCYLVVSVVPGQLLVTNERSR